MSLTQLPQHPLKRIKIFFKTCLFPHYDKKVETFKLVQRGIGFFRYVMILLSLRERLYVTWEHDFKVTHEKKLFVGKGVTPNKQTRKAQFYPEEEYHRRGPDVAVFGMAVTGQGLISSSRDETVRVWSTET
jgi:hypothetical protein